MKDREEMSLQEIKDSDDQELLAWYEREIKELCCDDISESVVKKNRGASIYRIAMMIEEEYQKYRSEILFSGELIQMYPGIKTHRAKKPITCDFSAGIIKPGSLYVSFRPFFKNIENGDAYVLSRTIRVESGYEQDIPQTLQELESFYVRAQSERHDSTHIDYNHFMTEMGGDLPIQKLNRRKQK